MFDLIDQGLLNLVEFGRNEICVWNCMVESSVRLERAIMNCLLLLSGIEVLEEA